MSIDYADIGKRIRYYRIVKKISQEKLAEAAELSVTHISHIETGSTKLSLPTIVKIANTLSASVDELLCDSIEQSKVVYDNEVLALIEDCTVNESRVIAEIIKAVKEALRKYQ